MSNYIVKTLLFIFPLLILLAVIEYKARAIPSHFEVKREILEQNLNNTEIIITGSSHAYYGIKPKLLSKPAVSIAYPGQDLYYDTRILLKYLPEAKNVKLVIVTISYLSFEYMMEDSTARQQTNLYSKHWSIRRQSSIPKLADYSATALYGFQNSRDYLLFGMVANDDEIDERGGNNNLLRMDTFKVMNGEIAVKRHESEMKIKYIFENRRYLDELFDALRESNTQIAIVTTPCFQSYYNNINKDQYLLMQNEIQEIAQKNNFEYYNYFKDERFTADDFFDSDHLNTTGAEKFSLILNNEVVAKYFPH